MMSVIYTTVPEKGTDRLSEALLKKRLVACVVMLDAKSMYWWKGKIAKDEEKVLLFKTTEQKAEKAIAEIRKLHPYGVPCILKFSAECNPEYLRWLEEETKRFK
ncbi:MAG: divalent-cation tolerance protein CutA [Candidatus Aenigmarchaeota archaeon]|nr:divalent-cation tolerance protein CutA [Candidatus Aenigmarchaeota archaeon]